MKKTAALQGSQQGILGWVIDGENEQFRRRVYRYRLIGCAPLNLGGELAGLKTRQTRAAARRRRRLVALGPAAGLAAGAMAGNHTAAGGTRVWRGGPRHRG